MKRECGENVEKMGRENGENLCEGLDRRLGQEATVRRTL